LVFRTLFSVAFAPVFFYAVFVGMTILTAYGTVSAGAAYGRLLRKRLTGTASAVRALYLPIGTTPHEKYRVGTYIKFKSLNIGACVFLSLL